MVVWSAFRRLCCPHASDVASEEFYWFLGFGISPHTHTHRRLYHSQIHMRLETWTFSLLGLSVLSLSFPPPIIYAHSLTRLISNTLSHMPWGAWLPLFAPLLNIHRKVSFHLYWPYSTKVQPNASQECSMFAFSWYCININEINTPYHSSVHSWKINELYLNVLKKFLMFIWLICYDRGSTRIIFISAVVWCIKSVNM